MRVWAIPLFLLIISTAYAMTTIVVGNCASGDYEFNNLQAALSEAEDHSDVNVWICGTRALERYTTVDTDYITIGGGTITSNNDRLVLSAVNVRLTDLNVQNTLIKVNSRNKAEIQDVNLLGDGYYSYCADVNARGDVEIDDVNVYGCPYGILIRRAEDLNVWSIYSGKDTVALKVLPGAVRGTAYVHAALMPVVKRVTEIVEKNIPMQEVVYRVPPEMYSKLKSCEQTVAALAKEKTELSNKISECESELEKTNKQEAQTPWNIVVEAAVAALGVGYLLGHLAQH